MARWILSIAVGLASLYVGSFGGFIYWAIFAADGSLIVAEPGTELQVHEQGVTVAQGAARVVGLTPAVLYALAIWYVILSVLAIIGVWRLASRRPVPRIEG